MYVYTQYGICVSDKSLRSRISPTSRRLRAPCCRGGGRRPLILLAAPRDRPGRWRGWTRSGGASTAGRARAGAGGVDAVDRRSAGAEGMARTMLAAAPSRSASSAPRRRRGIEARHAQQHARDRLRALVSQPIPPSRSSVSRSAVPPPRRWKPTHRRVGLEEELLQARRHLQRQRDRRAAVADGVAAQRQHRQPRQHRQRRGERLRAVVADVVVVEQRPAQRRQRRRTAPRPARRRRRRARLRTAKAPRGPRARSAPSASALPQRRGCCPPQLAQPAGAAERRHQPLDTLLEILLPPSRTAARLLPAPRMNSAIAAHSWSPTLFVVRSSSCISFCSSRRLVSSLSSPPLPVSLVCPSATPRRRTMRAFIETEDQCYFFANRNQVFAQVCDSCLATCDRCATDQGRAHASNTT